MVIIPSALRTHLVHGSLHENSFDYNLKGSPKQIRANLPSPPCATPALTLLGFGSLKRSQVGDLAVTEVGTVPAWQKMEKPGCGLKG